MELSNISLEKQYHKVLVTENFLHNWKGYGNTEKRETK